MKNIIQQVIIVTDDPAVLNRIAEQREEFGTNGFVRRVFVVNPYLNFIEGEGIDNSKPRMAQILNYGYGTEHEVEVVDDIIAWIGDNPKLL